MTTRDTKITGMMRAFIENDITHLNSLIKDLNTESIQALPSELRNMNARLIQIVSTLSSAEKTSYQAEIDTIRNQLQPLIDACNETVQSFQKEAKKQLDKLSQGAKLLDSYRVGERSKTRFLDSNG